ncbi:MAG: endonuclease/exonuclease/phosphatase family protein [Gammaproteobacteria bacterium SHHR-1]|uniref:endonuclease/exonuclease/phosphatase family protein n=1 Tax=Magnetovirga frankeli TaxID=947516 RepID=UPI001293DD73|nr:endonuclease/exonuclease/phosphatase family protein [gamma proteobacterium SS-5]
MDAPQPPRSLRLLSYNIQTGADSHRYRHYLTRGWRNWLPHPAQMPNLDRVAELVRDYDLVGLQEVDSGSLRSNFVDQTQYLGQRAGFGCWYSQVNRNLGALGQHSNGLLSRYLPNRIEEHKLPGNLPGRGALLAVLGPPEQELAVCVVHLALGQGGRSRQLGYIGELVRPFPHAIVMGDMNCAYEAPELQRLLQRSGLRPPPCSAPSFPSWRPWRRIDHILVSDSLEVRHAQVVDFPLSDHLPVCVEVCLPENFPLRRAGPEVALHKTQTEVVNG